MATFGVRTEVGKRFRVRVENRIDEPSLIHWHGLTPPWQQDGVPGVSGPPILPGSRDLKKLPLIIFIPICVTTSGKTKETSDPTNRPI